MSSSHTPRSDPSAQSALPDAAVEAGPSAAAEAGTGVVGGQYLCGGVWVVTAYGDIDHHTHSALGRSLELAAAAHPVVVLDAAGVTFGDSTFLNLLLRIHRQTDLRITGAPEQVLRLLELTGTDQVLRLYPDLTAASRP